MDVLAGFIGDCCVTGDMFQGKARAQDLYTAYRSWCERAGEESVSHREFGGRMKMKFKKDREPAGLFYYGIGLRDDRHDSKTETDNNEDENES
ncbi:MAG: hypothetical protein BMS9Abin05_2278 [Rhodothermia bacterium]|nr:MAG: hypothetical protein BMS9Abin05_2278 [Rhodothermia bacterium]